MFLQEAPSIANQVTALGTVFGAVSTGLLALIAFVQLRGLKAQLRTQKEQELRRLTLEACTRYETDPLLKSAMRRIWKASNFGTDYRLLDDSHTFDVLTLLNYLDGISIGIERGVYVDEDVRVQLEPIVEKCVPALLRGESKPSDSGPLWVGKVMADEAHFKSLVSLHDRWFGVKPTVGAAKVQVQKIFRLGRYELQGVVHPG